jgi:uncharacterized membrane protein (DUF485 family)
MDEELKQILKELREASPAVWNELVAQRALYSGVQAAIFFVFAIVAGVAAKLLLREIKQMLEGDSTDEDVVTFYTVLAVAAVLVAVVLTIVGSVEMAQAIAPLGHVLGAIR